jgi:alanyl-tRNA synthetase
LDLTRLMAEEKNFSVDEKSFDAEMEKARTRSQASWKGKGMEPSEAHLISWSQEVMKAHKPTKFIGYESLQSTSKILGLSDGQKAVLEIHEGQSGIVILDTSPFYAEGGGQIGDIGELKKQGGIASVNNCTKKNEVHLHFVQIQSGSLKVGDVVTAQVEVKTRRNTQAHHSATHLLHAALRQVLGAHVTQAGSLVESDRLRFDFTHHQPVTSNEISQIESLVNDEIGKNSILTPQVMKHEDAIKSGALALFGEKYGDQVRVLKMGNFSTELCGGTHVSNTAEIRMFKIISESGVSAGVRRIEAITGDTAVHFAMNTIKEFDEVLEVENMPKSFTYFTSKQTGNQSAAQIILSLKNQISEKEKEIKKLKGSAISVDELVGKAIKMGSTQVVAEQIDLEDRDILAQVSDQVKNKLQSGIVVLLGKGEATTPLLVSVSKDLSTKIKAGEILKELAAVMGGKGGGRPDFAQGAVPNAKAWEQAQVKLKEMMK